MSVEFDGDGRPTELRTPTLVYRYQPLTERLFESLTEGYLWFSPSAALGDEDTSATALDTQYTPDEFARYLTTIAPNEAIRDAQPLAEDPQRSKELLIRLYALARAARGICCFSRTCRSEALWQDRAGGFGGVCLGVSPMIMIQDGGLEAVAVDYARQTQGWNEVRERLSPTNVAQYYRRFAQAAFATKLATSAHEQELRLIAVRPGRMALPQHALAAVVCGPDMTAADRDRISLAVSDFPDATIIDLSIAADGSLSAAGLESLERDEMSVRVDDGYRRLDETQA